MRARSEASKQMDRAREVYMGETIGAQAKSTILAADKKAGLREGPRYEDLAAVKKKHAHCRENGYHARDTQGWFRIHCDT